MHSEMKPLKRLLVAGLATHPSLRRKLSTCDCTPWWFPNASGFSSDDQKRGSLFFLSVVRNSLTSADVNSGPSLPKARHKPERRGGGKTGMIDVNGKNNKVEQKNNKKTKTMGAVTLKGYDMTNTVTKGTGVRVHKQ